MVSKSYANLQDLTLALPIPSPPKCNLRRAMTSPGGVYVGGGADEGSTGASSDAPSSLSPNRVIIVANILPLHAHLAPLPNPRNPQNHPNSPSPSFRDSSVAPGGGRNRWVFTWDKDSLLLRLKDGLPEDMEVVYVGCLGVEIDSSEQDEVAFALFDSFRCVPFFPPRELRSRFYLGFCKQQLWPLFHYMLPMTPDHGGRFEEPLWQAYKVVNKGFAHKIMEIINPEDDFVWVHDYHLMLLPTFLRKKFHRVKLGFFLHSPFPSSEIYRTLPVREEILRGLLNSDLIGFQTFDYARHFLSCCSRMLGLEYASKRGYISLDYYGRTVGIKIMPVGIHMGQLEDVLSLPDTEQRIWELKAELNGKTVLLGVDDMDIFKGISLKLLAMEQLLVQHPEMRGSVVLVQIVNPARGCGKDIAELETETHAAARRINSRFGDKKSNYCPVVLIERHVPFYEKIAYYNIAECCIVTAVRDGLNLVPYEYVVCRQSNSELDARLGISSDSPKKSMIIISEFIGCSPSLSGAIRVNPWNIDAVAEAMNAAVTTPESEKLMRHEKHFRYVSTHDVAYWAQSFMADLERFCQNYARRRCYEIGFGLNFRVVALDPNFRKLVVEDITPAYERATRRAILLDYDGTVMPQTAMDKTPGSEVISTLNRLCNDPKNTVFIVSGRGRQSLGDWFSPCCTLGIAAEHGFFYRWHGDQPWTTFMPSMEFGWKEVVTPILNSYTECTDGSFIEAKESALVWQYRNADPDFGSWQAKELLDHLESVLANEPVSVVNGQHIVEVKPQGISKGIIVEHLLTTLASEGMPPDFVLCIGDDRSDEDMFESIESAMASPPQIPSAEVFACTVGQKPSKAKYYLDDTMEVRRVLKALSTTTTTTTTTTSATTTSLGPLPTESAPHDLVNLTENFTKQCW